MENKFQKYTRDRDDALLSLDKQKIENFCLKYGHKIDELGSKTFWTGIHKARLQVPSFPEEAKALSENWLKEHGFEDKISL